MNQMSRSEWIAEAESEFNWLRDNRPVKEQYKYLWYPEYKTALKSYFGRWYDTHHKQRTPDHAQSIAYQVIQRELPQTVYFFECSYRNFDHLKNA